MKTSGELIRERREQLGMSQEELAIKCGYANRSTISKVEASGNSVSLGKLRIIAEALHVDVVDLLPERKNTAPAKDFTALERAFDNLRESYYASEEMQEYAEAFKNNPGMRILFDTCKGATEEDLLKIAEIAKITLKK